MTDFLEWFLNKDSAIGIGWHWIRLIVPGYNTVLEIVDRNKSQLSSFQITGNIKPVPQNTAEELRKWIDETMAVEDWHLLYDNAVAMFPISERNSVKKMTINELPFKLIDKWFEKKLKRDFWIKKTLDGYTCIGRGINFEVRVWRHSYEAAVMRIIKLTDSDDFA